MKGLILKDIYSVRFQIICGLLILLLPNIMMFLSGGAGYEFSDTDMDRAMGIFAYGLINYISITVCSSFMLNTVSDDEKSGWEKMQRAMPLSGGEIIGGKLLATGFVLGALTAVSLISNAAGALMFGFPAEPMITMPIIFALLQAAALSVSMIFSYRFGSRSTTAAYIITVILVAAAIIAAVFGLFSEKITLTAMRLTAYAGVPVLSAAALLISFLIGRKAVLRDI